MVQWKAARYGKWYGTQALSTTMYILRILVVVKPYHCRTMLPDCTNTMIVPIYRTVHHASNNNSNPLALLCSNPASSVPPVHGKRS